HASGRPHVIQSRAVGRRTHRRCDPGLGVDNRGSRLTTRSHGTSHVPFSKHSARSHLHRQRTTRHLGATLAFARVASVRGGCRGRENHFVVRQEPFARQTCRGRTAFCRGRSRRPEAGRLHHLGTAHWRRAQRDVSIT